MLNASTTTRILGSDIQIFVIVAGSQLAVAPTYPRFYIG
jgi:hypothetical protein